MKKLLCTLAIAALAATGVAHAHPKGTLRMSHEIGFGARRPATSTTAGSSALVEVLHFDGSEPPGAALAASAGAGAGAGADSGAAGLMGAGGVGWGPGSHAASEATRSTDEVARSGCMGSVA